MTELTVQEVAALYWACLEEQNNVGLDWETFSRIPPALREVAPVERRLNRVRTADGCSCIGTIRVYDAARAKALVEQIGWEFNTELAKGIESARASFTECIAAYYRYKRALDYYG